MALAAALLVTLGVPGGGAAPSYSLQLSLSATRSSPVPLAGKSVKGLVYVFASPVGGVSQVRFYLDDPGMTRSPRRVELAAPFDFAGGSTTTASPFDTRTIADGSHTITAALVLSGGGTQVAHATFTVANTTPASNTVRVNFQSETAPVPSGYVRDYGQPYGLRTGANQGTNLTYGWVVPGTNTPMSLVGNGRDRNVVADQRLDTLVHMQAYLPEGAWELALANGTYSVTVSAGDASYINSVHRIRIEGQPGIANFVPTTAVKFATGTRTVFVSDGRLTIDAQGGTNAKTNYVTVVRSNDTTPPAPPSNVAAAAGNGQATVTWNANTEPDLAGYKIFRGTSLPVSTTGAPRNGTTLLQGTQYADSPLTNGSTYYYVVQAVDAAGNKAAALPVGVKPLGPPSVMSATPADGATAVSRASSVTARVALPNGSGIDGTTLTGQTVRLVRTSDAVQVPANLSTSGDVIVLDPTVLLEPNASYRLEVTSGLKDLHGAAFQPWTSAFTTTLVEFEKVALSTATGKSFTSLALGPDAKLYAGTIDGEIVRFPLAADGTTGQAEVIGSLQTANSGPRVLIGLAFDPTATADNLVLWVSHSVYAFPEGPDWGGAITRLSGANLETVQDYVVGLPRSLTGNHFTNSTAFGPDGALYLTQGSNTNFGEADSAFGFRPERLLNAAVLRVDLGAIAEPPLDVKTEEGGSYDPFASGAPLTLYATGLRNAYDLLWHSSGRLYVPTNGGGIGGSTPVTPDALPASCERRVDAGVNGAYTGPSVPGIASASAAQDDFLFHIVQGGYYGHPNPQRCEWVLNGGNPTSDPDPVQVADYPVGTEPDRNWRDFAHDFGQHYSPNGLIEYRSGTFDGALLGKLFVARYSRGDDVVVLTPGPGGDIDAEATGIPGLTGFSNPLDLAHDPASGFLYVTEHGAQKITLLRPLENATPLITSVEPAEGAAAVFRASSVTAQVTLPNGSGIDEATLTAQTVRLVSIGDDVQVPANLSASGGVFVLDPTVLLEPNASYRFEVTSGLRDLHGAAFQPWTSAFTTGEAQGVPSADMDLSEYVVGSGPDAWRYIQSCATSPVSCTGGTFSDIRIVTGPSCYGGVGRCAEVLVDDNPEGDPNVFGSNERIELLDDAGEAAPEREGNESTWWWRTWFPSDFVVSPGTFCMTAQWHDTSASVSPNLEVSCMNDRLSVVARGVVGDTRRATFSCVVDSTIPKGRWLFFKVHILWSVTENGHVEVVYDDPATAADPDRTCGASDISTMYPEADGLPPPEEVYVHQGLYRGAANESDVSGLFHDEMRQRCEGVSGEYATHCRPVTTPLG